MIIENGRIFAKGGNFIEGKIRFDRTIMEIGPSIQPPVDEPCLDVNGGYVIPGLVDIHTHGASEHDVCDADPEALKVLSRCYAMNGITSFCATTLTRSEEQLLPIMRVIGETPLDGAACVGIHMEGPFINPSRRGAQPAMYIQPPCTEMFRRLNAAGGGRILLVDIAPETDVDFRFTREVSRHCHVSFAHTDCDYKTAMEGFANGADHVTHLFNAMPPYDPFDPGLVGAAMDSGAYVELICDGYHVHPSVVKAVFRMFPPERICLISDSLRCAGMGDGEFTLAGQTVTVKEGKATLESGVLAGSTISLMEAVRRAVRFNVPLEQAVCAATRNPAASIGLQDRIGSLVPGANADLVVLDKDLAVRQVFIEGEAFLR